MRPRFAITRTLASAVKLRAFRPANPPLKQRKQRDLFSGAIDHARQS
jgi:hypothetical protein